MKTQWLDRRIALPGPHLCLCTTEAEYLAAVKHLGVAYPPRWITEGPANATAHEFGCGGKTTCVVCIEVDEDRTAIDIAGLLIHEAVHIWQWYCSSIGEHTPGKEQEAYGIQSIAEELLADYARRVK